MSWLNKGEVKIKDSADWEHTILDIVDLMTSFRDCGSLDEQKDYATKAISFVMGNLERRGIIDE